MSRRRLKIELLGRVAVVLIGMSALSLSVPVASAQAATITDTAAFSLVSRVGLSGSNLQPRRSGSQTQTQTVQLARFDAGLGTLTGVQFDLVSGASSATTTTAEIDERDAIQGVESIVDGNSTFALVEAVTGSTIFTESQADSLTCFDQFTHCAIYDRVNTFSFGGTTAASSVAAFAGSGVFDVDLAVLATADGIFNFSGPAPSQGGLGGVAFVAFEALYGGNLSVTYTYDPVPEPGAAVLICLGMGFLAVRQRSL